MSDLLDSRRHFLKGSCRIGALLAIGAPLATALSACDSADTGGPTPGPDSGVTISGNTITLDLTKSGAAPLAPAGGFLYLSAASTVLVNVGGTVKAFSSECPHEGNAVNRLEGGQLVCPTHDSRFNTSTGARVSGPARTGLRMFTVTQTGTTVTVTRS